MSVICVLYGACIGAGAGASAEIEAEAEEVVNFWLVLV